MFLSQNHNAIELKRLHDMALIRSKAKHQAEQLRQEAINVVFQSVGAAAQKVFNFIRHLGK